MTKFTKGNDDLELSLESENALKGICDYEALS